MKILVLLSPMPGTTPEQMRPVVAAETRHAYELYTSDVVREIYFRKDAPGAVMILEAKDAAEAAEIVGTLPLAKAGFIKPEIIPLAPFAVWDRLTPAS
jgi:hypothetical protein